LPPQAAGNFLLNGKKSPKNVFLIVLEVCCPQTARPCCWLRTARIPARDHRRAKLGSDRYRASCKRSLHAVLSREVKSKRERKKRSLLLDLTALASCSREFQEA
ncbi:MAG TPA: hypothetical protein VH082_08305, partial [Rudaea sp.]|nr:hypothetical protein [Rudaea sp.]